MENKNTTNKILLLGMIIAVLLVSSCFGTVQIGEETFDFGNVSIIKNVDSIAINIGGKEFVISSQSIQNKMEEYPTAHCVNDTLSPNKEFYYHDASYYIPRYTLHNYQYWTSISGGRQTIVLKDSSNNCVRYSTSDVGEMILLNGDIKTMAKIAKTSQWVCDNSFDTNILNLPACDNNVPLLQDAINWIAIH